MNAYLRRAGYPRSFWQDPPKSPLRRHLERSGARIIPLDRRSPNRGPSYTSCPACGEFAGVSIDAGEQTWRSTCGCMPTGELDVLDAVLLIYGHAA